MKIPVKVLLLVISIIGLGCSACMLSLFYEISVLTDSVKAYLAFFPWPGYVFAGYLAFLCACFFLLLIIALFSPRKTNDLVLVKAKGRLRFSRQTVESTVRYSFMDMEGVNFYKVRVKINRKPEKTKIYVKLSVNDASGLVELTEAIQGRIEAALGSSLSITAKSIQIKVVELNRKAQGMKEAGIEPVKSSRVI